jgi:SAM-dependent methyltransferase
MGLSEHLPIQPDCVDAVLLHHSLDIASDPRQVLREVERILVPEGHLIILGFNPRSMWGVRRFLSFRSHSAPWGMHFLPVKRIKDWLTLLGFDISMVRYGFFRPPLGRKGVVERLRFMESWGQNWWPFLGGVYLMVAKKKVATLTPIKPRWRPQRSIVAGLSDAASRSREANVQG